MRLKLGLCLGPDHVTAVAVRVGARGVRPAGTHERALAPREPDGSWPDLTAAVAEARAALHVPAGPVSVALLAPLAHAKVASVPPVRGEALTSLAQHGVRRYFVVPNDTSLLADAAVTPATRARAGGAARALIACADEGLVAAVADAVAATTSWTEQITPAAAALAAVGAELLPAARAGRTVLTVAGPDWTEALVFERGRLDVVLSLGKLPREAALAVASSARDRLHDDGPQATSVPDAPVADPGAADPAAGVPVGGAAGRAARGSGRRPDSPRALALGEGAAEFAATLAGAAATSLAHATPSLRGASAEVIVALGAVLAAGEPPMLLPAKLRAAVRARDRRRAARLWAAAAGALAIAAGVHLWGLQREVAAVRAERAALAGRVGGVLRARGQVEERRATLAAVARLEGAREHWAGALATVSDALPEAAYLVSFAAAGAEIRLGGLAASGHEVIPALTAVPRFRGVTLTAPLRREPETGLERFDVRFSIARRQPGDARTAATRAPSGDGR